MAKKANTEIIPHADGCFCKRLSEHYLFICAGLGEWGTSGATYFLFDRWNELNKRFKKRKNFCLIIEVDVGSDESASEIFSYTV